VCRHGRGFIIFVSPNGEAAIIGQDDFGRRSCNLDALKVHLKYLAWRTVSFQKSTRDRVVIARAVPLLIREDCYRFEQTHSQRGL
jgi:hypothetical protein